MEKEFYILKQNSYNDINRVKKENKGKIKSSK